MFGQSLLAVPTLAPSESYRPSRGRSEYSQSMLLCSPCQVPSTHEFIRGGNGFVALAVVSYAFMVRLLIPRRVAFWHMVR